MVLPLLIAGQPPALPASPTGQHWLKQLPPATAGLAAWLYTRHAELPVISLPAGATVPGSHGTRWLCALAPAAVIQSLLEALWLSDYEQLGHNSRLAANSGT